MDNKGITARKLCALTLQGKCGDWEEVNNWNVRIPEGKPEPVEPELPPVHFIAFTLLDWASCLLCAIHCIFWLFFTFIPTQEDAPKYKILHLSDIHLDLSYQIGANSDCGKPMCCMNSTGLSDDVSKAAGPWGSYTCDLPYWTFEDMLMHIKETHADVRKKIMLIVIIIETHFWLGPGLHYDYRRFS